MRLYMDAGYKELQPKEFMKKWYLELKTEIGNVMLLDKNVDIPIPLVFESKELAEKYLLDNY